MKENKRKFLLRCFNWLRRHNMLRVLSDKQHIKTAFKLKMGYKLDLSNPKTFNEKLQWLKLYDRNPIYTTMADKYLAKQFVADRIGNEYVVPLLGVWTDFDDIDFDKLPNQFVLKTTHDSGGVCVCKDKASFDREAAKKFLKKHLKIRYFYHCREWPYKNVVPRIIAEEYLQDSDCGDKNNAEEGLTDYKFFCFDGKPKAMYVATDRAAKDRETKLDYFDMDFNHLPFTNAHPNADIVIEKPKSFELMKDLAKKLSEGFPHVRVDFYESNGKIFFGELTFYHFGGLAPFVPQEWDYIFGEWITLPQKQQN